MVQPGSTTSLAIVAEIFGFFSFFAFSRWFCYAFRKGPLIFLVFLLFLDGLLPLCVGLCLPQTLGENGRTHAILRTMLYCAILTDILCFTYGATSYESGLTKHNCVCKMMFPQGAVSSPKPLYSIYYTLCIYAIYHMIGGIAYVIYIYI